MALINPPPPRRFFFFCPFFFGVAIVILGNHLCIILLFIFIITIIITFFGRSAAALLDFWLSVILFDVCLPSAFFGSDLSFFHVVFVCVFLCACAFCLLVSGLSLFVAWYLRLWLLLATLTLLLKTGIFWGVCHLLWWRSLRSKLFLPGTALPLTESGAWSAYSAWRIQFLCVWIFFCWPDCLWMGSLVAPIASAKGYVQRAGGVQGLQGRSGLVPFFAGTDLCGSQGSSEIWVSWHCWLWMVMMMMMMMMMIIMMMIDEIDEKDGDDDDDFTTIQGMRSGSAQVALQRCGLTSALWPSWLCLQKLSTRALCLRRQRCACLPWRAIWGWPICSFLVQNIMMDSFLGRSVFLLGGGFSSQASDLHHALCGWCGPEADSANCYGWLGFVGEVSVSLAWHGCIFSEALASFFSYLRFAILDSSACHLCASQAWGASAAADLHQRPGGSPWEGLGNHRERVLLALWPLEAICLSSVWWCDGLCCLALKGSSLLSGHASVAVQPLSLGRFLGVYFMLFLIFFNCTGSSFCLCVSVPFVLVSLTRLWFFLLCFFHSMHSGPRIWTSVASSLWWLQHYLVRLLGWRPLFFL